MITSVLVANRGEIARRVFRTCRELGLGTVAVYSDADADAAHVREADAAVRLPGAAPADTYLRADLVIAAAQSAGADAVHPGYGFLSENAEFARAVGRAGLVWVGPPAGAIAAMGSKTEAKRIMAAAGVPVLGAVDPGSAAEADLPLLVKAAAGGGGRGMRLVRELAELPAQLAAARAEAASAFGDEEIFCEPYLEAGRHIEVQILADAHGTVWALGERDCSIQRRHQKVVEESPAPAITDALRRALHEAAEAAARAIGYTGAGTVEFLVPTSGPAATATRRGRFYFLEMNTRLQVEHPVTECVTGLDLVRLQLLVAEGERLPGRPPARRGHAIEARLYAEDPAHDWQPQAGDLHRLDVPGVTARFGPPGGVGAGADSGLRLDAGFEAGGAVGVHYDPLLAKVIAWAPSRSEAARRLAHALARARIHGLTTNRDLLVRVLCHPAFLAGEVDTGFLTRHHADVTAYGSIDKETVLLAALAAALADAAAGGAAAPAPHGRIGGWRNVPSQPQVKGYHCAATGTEHQVRYRLTRSGLDAEGHAGAALVAAAPDRVVLAVGGVRRTFDVARYADLVHVDSPLGSVALTALPRFPDPSAQAAPGSLLAPMPGTVVRVDVAQGDSVRAGQPLLWLEAMKMQHRVAAPADGSVAELGVAPGQQVDVGTVLAVVTPAAGPTSLESQQKSVHSEDEEEHTA